MRIDTRSIVSCGLAAAAMLLLVLLWHGLNLVDPPPPAPDVSSFLYQVASVPFLLALSIVASVLGALLSRPVPIALGAIVPLVTALVLDLSRKPASHNLFPFEIVMGWLPVFLISLAMAHLGAWLRRARSHRDPSGNEAQ